MHPAIVCVLFLLLSLLPFLLHEGFRRYQKSRRSAYQPPARSPGASPTSTKEGADFNRQVVVITGGGTGLGRAMALEMAKRGAKLVLASRNPEHLESTAQEISALGSEVLWFSIDVRKPDQVQEMVDATVRQFGKIDVLINNAAGNFLCPAEKLSSNGFNAVVGIVLTGTWNCTSAVGKVMIAQGKGCVLNILANYAGTGQPGVVHSACAKSGVLSMTETLAAEWGAYGIRLNAFAPGAMVTEGASTNLQYNSQEAQERIISRIPVGRLSSAEEMAKYAAFLCSDQSAYMSGAMLTADGGQCLPRGFMELKDLSS